MGVIKQGILGGFSGKVANVVGSSWKGIPVIKSLPLSVANPRTASQTAQRTKFASVVTFASSILAVVVKPLWDRFAQGQSGYNAFVSANIDNFDEDGLSDFAELKISSGKMASTAIDSVQANSGGNTAILAWSDDSGEGLKLASDVPFAIVVDEDGIVIGQANSGATRSLGGLPILLDRDLANGETVHVYLAFRRADGTVVSDTSHDSKVAT
jgi:hypothetical protein